MKNSTNPEKTRRLAKPTPIQKQMKGIVRSTNKNYPASPKKRSTQHYMNLKAANAQTPKKLRRKFSSMWGRKPRKLSPRYAQTS